MDRHRHDHCKKDVREIKKDFWYCWHTWKRSYIISANIFFCKGWWQFLKLCVLKDDWVQTEVPANDAIPVDLLLQRLIPANMYNVFQCHEKSNLQKKGQIIENTKNENYFTSSDPHHDISKQLVDTTFVWSFCHGTLAQPTIPIICFTWQVIVHVSLSNRI